MAAARPWTRTEGAGLIAGLILFVLLQQPALTGPAAEAAPYGGVRAFLDAQFRVFATSHSEHGLSVTHGLPVWRVAADGALCVHNSHPPTVALLEYLAAGFDGVTWTAVRLPALLFTTGMIALMYLLLRRAFPLWAAVLGTLALAMTPLFFHLAACPEVFLLAHLPLLGVLYVALFGFEPPPPPPLPPEPDAFPPEASHQAELDFRTRQIETHEKVSRRRRRWALALLAAAAVAVSYHAVGVLIVWAAVWWGARRTRHTAYEALAVVAGLCLALLVLLTWLHLGGGSVEHWFERGWARVLSAQPDRSNLAAGSDATAVGWSALAALQWDRTFQAAGFAAWLGLIGIGLALIPQFRRQAAEAAGHAVGAQRGLFLGLALLFAIESFAMKQNAWTHVYTVSATGFLIAFGLAAIGENAVLGFQRIGRARDAAAQTGLRRVKIPHLMGIILSLTALATLYRNSEIIDEQQTWVEKNDMAPLVAAIDAAHAANPGPVLVYDDWLLPAQTVTGEEAPPEVGYLFPWYYTGRAFLCYRRPQVGPEHFRAGDRPTLILWPVSQPFDGSEIRTAAIHEALRQEGYTRHQVGYMILYTLRPFELPPAALAVPPEPAPTAGGPASGAPRP